MVEDGFRRFEYECPKCGTLLGEYAERCPDCGQNLFEVFSGSYTPGAGRLRNAVTYLLLGALALSMLGAVVGAVARLFGEAQGS